jgi:hypothetical protein
MPRSAAHPGHQRIRQLEIGIDVLHVVIVVEQVHQPEQLLAIVVVDRDIVLRPPGQGRLAGLAEPGFQRLRYFRETFGGGGDLVAGLARDDIIRAGLDRRLQSVATRSTAR